MKLRLYFPYTLRSLARGGQRTALAIFCVAVGVMAIVALQLAGLMIDRTITANIREINGGDVSVRMEATPLSRDQLAYFETLKQQGRITAWTAISQLRSTGRRGSERSRPIMAWVVDPSQYPLAGTLDLVTPKDSSFGKLLSASGNAIVSESLREEIGVSVGDRVQISSAIGPIGVTIAGVVRDSGLNSTSLMYVGETTASASARLPLSYSDAYVTTPNAAGVAAALREHYPIANVQTTDDALQTQKDNVANIRHFLQIAGLLALLIGGVGIVNTMQVLLSRRRIEIAMLKTAGFRRRDLYGLFGLEAAWLGLVGGLVGAVLGFGLSFGVKALIENALLIHLVFVADGWTIASGVLVGLTTALIFGILPIVRAAGIRPLAVIRDLSDEHGWRTRALTSVLILLLALLFSVLATVILGDIRWALASVLGTVLLLGLMGLVFVVVLTVVTVLPVPEHFSLKFLALVTVATLVAVGITFVLAPVGAVLLFAALMGYVVVLLPREWKATTKLALRGIGRQRARTTATLVALFVGVFVVGLILIMGQDIRGKLESSFSTTFSYNVFAITSPTRSSRLEAAIPGLPGLREQRLNDTLQTTPVSINGEPIGDFVSRARLQPGGFPDFAMFSVAGLEGNDIADGHLPQASLARDARGAPAGRLLTMADAGTANFLGPSTLLSGPWHLTPGATLTIANQLTHQTQTITLVGFYTFSPFGTDFHFAPLLGDQRFVDTLGGDTTYRVFSLKIDPAQKARALRQLGDADPDAGLIDLTDFGSIVNKLLQNLIILLTAIASMALFAGVVIIANAVALAMLERRREIGILKSVGYESRSVLSQVLLENGIVGGISGVLAMSAIAVAMTLLGKFFLHTDLGVGTPLALAIMVGAVVLASVTAGLVAWGPTRVPPLEVLRYE